jgi:ferredoxin-type protein NapH
VRWTRWRRISQLFSVAFFIALPITNRMGQVEVLGTLASLKLGPIELSDPAVGLSSILASGTVVTTMLTGLILPVLLALVLGPVFCAWVCPWGLFSELIDRVRRRTTTPDSKKPGRLRWITLAALLLLSLAFGLPVVTLVSVPRLITLLPLELIFLGGVSLGTLGLLVGILVLELVLPRRLWCRALCPVGSLLTLLRIPRTLTVAWDEPTCVPASCGVNCAATCPWLLDPRHMAAFDGCTNCGVCIEGCPDDPGVSLSFSFKRQARRRP